MKIKPKPKAVLLQLKITSNIFEVKFKIDFPTVSWYCNHQRY